MGERLKCDPRPPLREMALVKIAVLLWGGSEILTEISEMELYLEHIIALQECLEPMGKKIKDRVFKLGLPESLTKQTIDVAQPIGVKMCRWEYYKDNRCSFSPQQRLSVLSNIRWTMRGRIDDRKTAEGLVHCNALSVVSRYEIACRRCLEDSIPLLWEELPERIQEYVSKSQAPSLEYCWPHILSGELSKLDHLWRSSARNLTSFNQWAFEYSAYRGNKTAVHYFFQKLSHMEGEASLVRAALAVKWSAVGLEHRVERFVDTFCYLLSLMSLEQQMELLNARPADVFVCFLHDPRQTLFLHNARIILNFLPPTRHGELLCAMAGKLQFPGCYFPKLVQEFIRQSPLHLKRVFVDDISFPAYDFLSVFFYFEDSDSIKVLLRNVGAAGRVKILFDGCVLGILCSGIARDQMALVALCVREASLSRGDRERLEGHLKLGYRGVPTEIKNEWVESFFEYFDEANACAEKERKAVKRKLET